ncbi:hypothetical protein [Mesorhizobium sp. M4B.F.Ca.ET.058.02.1.1]|uniref:hypothetical protein n=1 Tax=Mesorhizobium sp. M4B.F.Ca.ET.058.02.1.1 TaxID=2493675 RepID=UPI000F74E2E5|nr:hypothetical protein [Mesorhizobium sp. M4B.F.Ca.ET.058.02.1.1]AZO48081.1 hypothetical protein EJ073_09820 [Mesorhizobium sp. M4B.F.Ca.ET.058.02.1.1]
MPRTFSYLTSSKDIDIDWLSVDNMLYERDSVQLTELRSNCKTAIIEQHLGYGPGNPMADDPNVKFYRSRYLGKDCYFIAKDDVQYIFSQP